MFLSYYISQDLIISILQQKGLVKNNTAIEIVLSSQKVHGTEVLILSGTVKTKSVIKMAV